MFKIQENKPKEPRTISRTYRLPVEMVRWLEHAKNKSGVGQTQILVQMWKYCTRSGLAFRKDKK